MKVVGIVGRSDAGKTTLIERLIPVLKERGQVATIKSIHHAVDIDEGGKDTHRHRSAGAETVVGVTPSLTFSIKTQGKNDFRDEEAMLRRLLSDLSDDGFDYILVEGFTESSIPKLIVGRHVDGSLDRVLTSIPDSTVVDLGDIVDRIDQLEEWVGT